MDDFGIIYLYYSKLLASNSTMEVNLTGKGVVFMFIFTFRADFGGTTIIVESILLLSLGSCDPILCITMI